MNKFSHIADNLNDIKKIVFTAQSAKNFHQRMLICRHAFDEGVIPINPFNTFGYYLYELVDRDTVRNGNNNILARCDELWVYGDVSDGILSEIKSFGKTNRTIRYFDISGLPKEVTEVELKDLPFEPNVERYKEKFITDTLAAKQ